MTKILQETFINTIEKHGLLRKRERIMLGVSGGPDSMCLAQLFMAIKGRYKLDLVIAHFNHSLRPESDAEETFVKEYAGRMGVKYVSEKKIFDEADIDSLEQTARQYRFHFFVSRSRVLRIKKIALAHTKDDLAETVLMRIMRGSGLLGISGFGVQSRYKTLAVIRPLIEARKEEILAFLKQENISYCLDRSNEDERFLRNKIRHQLIPYLEKEYNPAIRNILVTLAKTASVDYDYLVSEAREQYRALRRREGARAVSFRIEALKKLHPSLVCLVLRMALEDIRGNLRRIDYRHLEDLLCMITSARSEDARDLPGITAEKYQGELLLKNVNLLDFKTDWPYNPNHHE